MAFGCVGAHQHHQLGGIEVVVAAGGAVGAEAAAVAHHGRTHAQPGIGIEVIATQGPLEQLVGDVIILDQKLAGAVDGDGIGSAGLQGGANAAHNQREGLLPADRRKRLVYRAAVLGAGEAVMGQGVAHGGPLNAHLAQGGGVMAIAAGRPGFATRLGRLELQTTTHAAVGTLGSG